MNNLDEEEYWDPDEELAEARTKSAVECICPKCGKTHYLKFHWIGRGKPRKFCNHCRPNFD